MVLISTIWRGGHCSLQVGTFRKCKTLESFIFIFFSKRRYNKDKALMKLVKFQSSADSITVYITTDSGVCSSRARVTMASLDHGSCEREESPDWTEALRQPYRYSLYKVMLYKKQIKNPFIRSYKHYILSIYTNLAVAHCTKSMTDSSSIYFTASRLGFIPPPSHPAPAAVHPHHHQVYHQTSPPGSSVL